MNGMPTTGDCPTPWRTKLGRDGERTGHNNLGSCIPLALAISFVFVVEVAASPARNRSRQTRVSLQSPALHFTTRYDATSKRLRVLVRACLGQAGVFGIVVMTSFLYQMGFNWRLSVYHSILTNSPPKLLFWRWRDSTNIVTFRPISW